MFYKLTIKDHVRVPPHLFNENVDVAVRSALKEKFTGLIDRDFGVVISIGDVHEIGEGIVIPGDGASYYECSFDLVVFKPELQEIVFGRVVEITEFGAFINIGPLDGMIHISQTMDDIVTFSKSKVLSGKESKKNLKIGDRCKAKIIALSFKEVMNPKIGLTMRQKYLGKEEWINEDIAKERGE